MTIRRPEQFTHHEARLDGVRIHYVREGRQGAPPLVLLHGSPGFWWEWQQNIAPLAKHFDVIVPDMRGHGDSEKPDLSRPELYNVNCVVDDVVHLLDHLKIPRAHLVGHDWSGVAVHKMVRRYRARVIRAAVLNPITPGFEERFYSPSHAGESWHCYFNQCDMAAALVGSSRDACRLYYSHFLNSWSYDKELFRGDELELYVDNYMKPGNIRGGFNFYRANCSQACGQGSWQGSAQAKWQGSSQASGYGDRQPCWPWDQSDWTISDCPMTFLCGLSDPAVPSAWSDLVSRWYNKYTIEYLDKCGHYVMREQPEAFNRRLEEVLLK